MDKSETCLVPFTCHISAVSHVIGIKIDLLDRTLIILLVQERLVAFGQNVCYRRKEGYLFYLDSARGHIMLFVKYS